MRFAKRTEKVFFSATRKYAEKAKELRSSGININTFGRHPDTSKHIKDAAIEMTKSGEAAKYTDQSGLPELRNIFSKKLKIENNIDANPDSEIIVTIGGKEALFLAYMSILNPGDEVIIQDPAWPSFSQTVPIAGGIPVSLKLNEEENWGITEGDIEKLITPKTKMIVINDPHNPTGTMYDKKTVNYIADVVRDHDLTLVTDECYEKTIDPQKRHYSIASLPGMREKTISVFTATKLYNMYGWRVGFTVSNESIIEKMLAIHSQIVGCAPSISQAGAIAAISNNVASGDMSLVKFKKEYQEVRDTIFDLLNDIPRVSCIHGRAGFWVFPDFSELGMSSLELHDYLLNHNFVMEPGIEFGMNGEDHLRLSYGLGLEEIKNSFEKLKSALTKI
jgi:aspartate/methionine/tyrosine aminotransferase